MQQPLENSITVEEDDARAHEQKTSALKSLCAGKKLGITAAGSKGNNNNNNNPHHGNEHVVLHGAFKNIMQAKTISANTPQTELECCSVVKAYRSVLWVGLLVAVSNKKLYRNVASAQTVFSTQPSVLNTNT